MNRPILTSVPSPAARAKAESPTPPRPPSAPCVPYTPRVGPTLAAALAHVLTYAAEVGLPEPVAVLLTAARGDAPEQVVLDAGSLADLTEWSRYLEVPIDTETLTEGIDHHTVVGEAFELPLRLRVSVDYRTGVRV